MSIQITRIRKPDPQSPHYSVIAYGCPRNDGTLGIYEREFFIKWLKENNTSAYVSSIYGNIPCQIRNNGHVNYLQSVANGQWTDNLLSLPQC